MTYYTDFNDLNKLQTAIMLLIDKWVHENKEPIPRREIILGMKKIKVNDFTVIASIKVLLAKGYIRRSVATSNKDCSYVQLRRV